MFHPPTFHTESVFEPAKLDEPIGCICGNKAPMHGRLCVWTTSPQDPEPGWYIACNATCILKRITEGHAS